MKNFFLVVLLFAGSLAFAGDPTPQFNSVITTPWTDGGGSKQSLLQTDGAGIHRLPVDILGQQTGVIPGSINDGFFEYLINAASSSSDMRVNGVGPVGEIAEIKLPMTTGTDISGECFELDTPSTAYYLWYDTDNGSTDPAIGGRTGIEVDVAAADDEVAIATKQKDKMASMGADFANVTKPTPDTVQWANVAVGNVTDADNCSSPNNIAGVQLTVIVEGRSTGATVVFKATSDATKRTFVTQVRCFGGGNGIQFTKFLSQNSALEQGLLLTVKSGDMTFTIPPIKTTEDFKNIFATPLTTSFSIDVQAGADQFIAIFKPVAFTLEIDGTFGTDDFIQIEVRDDLSLGLLQLECAILGNKI